MGVDEKCIELADHFLAATQGAKPEDRQELAEAFQEVAEDFCRTLEGDGCCPGCGACPGFTGVDCDGECDWARASA
jgi:hypothetical protein